MKKLFFITLFVAFSANVFAQRLDYYSETENKKGNELKISLHNIIRNHIDFSYNDAKYILEYAQEDPNKKSYLIQFYTGRSVKKGKKSWGTGGDLLNREHVWAASHGSFRGKRPMDGDAHNLHAADASVNVTRSNYDFDNVPTGTYIEEADARYGNGAFEPSNREKGEVARTLFYMAVRYEGTNGELDMKMADAINTADLEGAMHGKLSTLLDWNKKYPPSDFERRRNERVAQCQGNRNPFIDNPEFADLIWGNAEPSKKIISHLTMKPKNPKVNERVKISAKVSTEADTTPTLKLFWGKTYNSETYQSKFSGNENMETTFLLDHFSDNEMVYLKIVSSSGEILHHSFYIAPNKKFTSISDIQETDSLNSKNVTISGIVTANFDNSFYMQSSSKGKYSGICVYSNWRGHIGDSIAVSGKVDEYENLTELKDVSMVYNYGKSKMIAPKVLNIDQIGEDYEGMLVKLENVSVENAGQKIEKGNIMIHQGEKKIPMYVRYNARIIGYEIPDGTLHITGVVSQYKDTYQLLIDNIGWIEQVNDKQAPMITNAKTIDENYIEVTFNKKIKEESVTLDAFSIEGLTIEMATYYPKNKVYLLVKGLQKKEYTLLVNGIQDLFGNTVKNEKFIFNSTIVSVVEKKLKNTIKVYPIPAIGEQIFVESNELINSYKMYNLTGQLVDKANEVKRKRITLSLEKLSKGSYLLLIETKNNVHKKVLIK